MQPTSRCAWLSRHAIQTTLRTSRLGPLASKERDCIYVTASRRYAVVISRDRGTYADFLRIRAAVREQRAVTHDLPERYGRGAYVIVRPPKTFTVSSQRGHAIIVLTTVGFPLYRDEALLLMLLAEAN